jgi:hypothetical protein
MAGRYSASASSAVSPPSCRPLRRQSRQQAMTAPAAAVGSTPSLAQVPFGQPRRSTVGQPRTSLMRRPFGVAGQLLVQHGVVRLRHSRAPRRRPPAQRCLKHRSAAGWQRSRPRRPCRTGRRTVRRQTPRRRGSGAPRDLWRRRTPAAPGSESSRRHARPPPTYRARSAAAQTKVVCLHPETRRCERSPWRSWLWGTCLAGRSGAGGPPSGTEPLSDGLAPPFHVPFLGAVEQLRDGASLVGGYWRMCPAELGQQRGAHRHVQIVGGPQQPPSPGSVPSRPCPQCPPPRRQQAGRGRSRRRKLVNAASDAEGPSRPWGTGGSGVSGSSSPASAT